MVVVASADVGNNAAIQQIPLTTAIFFIAIVLSFVDPDIFTKITFGLGTFVILANALMATLSSVRALPSDSRLRLLIPALDIVGIALMTANENGLVLSVLFLIPLTYISMFSSKAVSQFSSLATSGVLVVTTVLSSGGMSGERGVWLAIFPVVSFVLCRAINLLSHLTRSKGRLLALQLVETQRSREREIAQQESLDFVLNAVAVAILRIGDSGQVLYTNKAYQDLVARSGWTSNLNFGGGIFHEDRLTPYNDSDHPIIRTMLGQELIAKVVWLGTPGIDQHPFLIDALRFTDVTGMFTGAIFSLTDITDDMELNKIREDFVVTMSHEIRNPLTAVVGNLDLALENNRLPPKIRKNLLTATDNSLRILDLVTRLLDGITVGEELAPPTQHPTDLVQLLRQGCDSIAPAASIRGITVLCTPAEPIMLNIDCLQVLQVIENLLSNAVKYNCEGGTITISACTDETSSTVVLRITDTGPGIPLHEHEKVFQRFYRTPSARKSAVHGTGLGLNISRSIMRRMGGDLTIDSGASPGIGTGTGTGTTVLCIFPAPGSFRTVHGTDISRSSRGVNYVRS